MNRRVAIGWNGCSGGDGSGGKKSVLVAVAKKLVEAATEEDAVPRRIDVARSEGGECVSGSGWLSTAGGSVDNERWWSWWKAVTDAVKAKAVEAGAAGTAMATVVMAIYLLCW